MESIAQEKLLSDRRVVEEINRHLWFESEKVGYDIGFEKAKEDWLKNFSKAWMDYHLPGTPSQTPKASSKIKTRQKSVPRKRRAKSYLK